MMNFAAYLFMGIPAGNLLIRIGYKKTALWAMAVGVAGLFVRRKASVKPIKSKPGLCVWRYCTAGLLICGFCVCMLNTVVNPMLNLLGGGGNRGNQLIQTGGATAEASPTMPAPLALWSAR